MDCCSLLQQMLLIEISDSPSIWNKRLTKYLKYATHQVFEICDSSNHQRQVTSCQVLKSESMIFEFRWSDTSCESPSIEIQVNNIQVQVIRHKSWLVKYWKMRLVKLSDISDDCPRIEIRVNDIWVQVIRPKARVVSIYLDPGVDPSTLFFLPFTSEIRGIRRIPRARSKYEKIFSISSIPTPPQTQQCRGPQRFCSKLGFSNRHNLFWGW